MRKTYPFTLCLFLAVMISSCTSKDYRQVMKVPEQKFYQGKFLEAARMILPEVNKSGRDQLLFMMECGYMLHAGKDYKKSNKVLLPAGRLAKVVPISISKQAAALLTNQRKTNYRGEDFEKVLVHMYLGINFLMVGNSEDARVEFKKVNNELSKIKTEKGTARYKQNIMAKYLTAIAYEIIGDMENDDNDREFAYIEYKQIYQLNPGLQMVQRDLQRLSKKLDYTDDYDEWLAKFGKKDSGTEGTGELVMIFQSGRNAIKKSRGKLMSDPAMKNSIRVSLNSITLQQGVTIAAILTTLATAENPIPYFKKRSNRTRNVRISVDGRTYSTVRLEDIEGTAIQNLKDDYGRLKGKVAASIVVKAAASIAAGIAAKKLAERSKKLGGYSSLIGLAAGMGTGTALFSQMKPDLRCWHTLPANLQLSRVFLKPGKHRVKLDFIGYNNSVLSSKTVDVNIKKDKKSFINERALL